MYVYHCMQFRSVAISSSPLPCNTKNSFQGSTLNNNPDTSQSRAPSFVNNNIFASFRFVCYGCEAKLSLAPPYYTKHKLNTKIDENCSYIGAIRTMLDDDNDDDDNCVPESFCIACAMPEAIYIYIYTNVERTCIHAYAGWLRREFSSAHVAFSGWQLIAALSDRNRVLKEKLQTTCVTKATRTFGAGRKQTFSSRQWWKILRTEISILQY